MNLKKTKLKIRRRLAKIYWGIFGQMDYKRTIILTHARSGSNLLANAIKTDPSVQVINEPFSTTKKTGKTVEQICASCFGKKPTHIKHVVLKMFSYDLDPYFEWPVFMTNYNPNVINLIRKDKLAILASFRMAKKTQQYKTSDKILPLKERTVFLEPNFITETLGKILYYENWIEKQFFFKKRLIIYYEDICEDKQKEFKRVNDYLNINIDTTGKNLIKKQNPEPLEQRIINFKEAKFIAEEMFSS
jgi:hypothetical protein